MDRHFLPALFLASLVAFIWVIHVFLIPIVLALVFVTLFYPFYLRLLKRFRGKRWAGALACCLILLAGLLGSLLFVANMAVVQALEVSHDVLPRIQASIERGDRGIIGKIKKLPAMRWMQAYRIDWRSSFEEGLKASGAAVVGLVNALSRLTLTFFLDLFVMFFVMFFLFRDADFFLAKLKKLIPLDARYTDRILRRFATVSRSAVRVTLVIGIIQGSLGALTLLAFGVPAWFLWGVVIMVLAVLPVVGSWTVLVPAGMIEIMSGRIWQGIAIIFMGTVVIALIDDILRPRLVGRGTGIHDLLIFVSTLGGIAVFGFSGFIIGPVIAAIFATVADIYSGELLKKDNNASRVAL